MNKFERERRNTRTKISCSNLLKRWNFIFARLRYTNLFGYFRWDFCLNETIWFEPIDEYGDDYDYPYCDWDCGTRIYRKFTWIYQRSIINVYEYFWISNFTYRIRFWKMEMGILLLKAQNTEFLLDTTFPCDLDSSRDKEDNNSHFTGPNKICKKNEIDIRNTKPVPGHA